MAIDNFIPEIWEPELETEFHANQIVIPTVRQDFTGILAAGNTVHITGAPDVSIQDYSSTRTLSTEALKDDGLDLLIDQEKAFSFYVDDIDRVQAAGSFEAYTTSAGEALAEDAETYLLDTMLAGSWSLNVTGDSPVTVNSYASAKTALLNARKFLNKKKVATGNRYAVVNPDFATYLVDGLSDNSIAGGSDELRNGVIARVWGFTILESPLLGANDGKPRFVAYNGRSVGFVSQIQKMEALRATDRFDDIVRGLNVYGAKVIRQQAVASFVSGGTTQNAFSSFLS